MYSCMYGFTEIKYASLNTCTSFAAFTRINLDALFFCIFLHKSMLFTHHHHSATYRASGLAVVTHVNLI